MVSSSHPLDLLFFLRDDGDDDDDENDDDGNSDYTNDARGDGLGVDTETGLDGGGAKYGNH